MQTERLQEAGCPTVGKESWSLKPRPAGSGLKPVSTGGDLFSTVWDLPPARGPWGDWANQLCLEKAGVEASGPRLLITFY